jgi:type II secretory pathway component PulF
MLEQIHSDVLAGNPVSDSLRRYVHVFGETFVASIAAGEASGRVSDVLDELVRFQRNDLRLRSTLRTVLAYPILLTTVSLLVIVGLVLFVLPNFSEIFEQYEMSLPALTLCLLGVSTGLRAHLWLWGGLAIVGLAGLIALRRSDAGKRAWDGAVLNMVLVRDVTRALLIGRTCRLLGIMIDSGVPLLECLRLARSSVRNTLYRDLFARLEDDVINGRGLANGLLNADFVPSAAAEMVVTAERTGAMKTVTDLIGQHYEEEGEGKLRELVALLEPAIIVVMGVVVAAVVLAVMLPMFDIATLAQKGS